MFNVDTCNNVLVVQVQNCGRAPMRGDVLMLVLVQHEAEVGQDLKKG